MNTQTFAAILLLGAGTMALVYGGFTYTEDTQEFEIGGLQVSIDEKKRVNVPIWAGIGAIVIGGLLLVASKKTD